MPTVEHSDWGDASLRVEISWPSGDLRIVRPNGSKPRLYVPVDDGYEPLKATGDNSGIVVLDR